MDNSGTCEAPNCANGVVTCPSGQTCNKTSKLCEAVTDPLSLCLQKIAEDDPSAVFVSNFDEFKAVGTGIETVVLTDNIDAADKSFTLKVKNRDTQYINSAHTRKYYNPLTYSLEKGGKITIPECKALLTGGDRFGYGYAYEEPFDFKLTLKEAVINDDIIGNDKEEVSFYVPVSIDAVRVKSKGYGCSVSIYEPCGYGDKVLVYFDRITEVTGISDGVVTEGANVGVKFGDVAVINSYKNGADFGNLYLHGDYSRPFNDMMGWGTRNCPAIIFFKQSRGAFFTVDLLRFDLETDTLNCRYLGLNGATIRTSYNEEYGSGGTIFDFGPYISGDLTVNLFSGCLHNILANRYLCGSGSDLSYSFSGACDQEGKAIKYNEGFSTKCHKLSAGTVKTYSYYPY